MLPPLTLLRKPWRADYNDPRSPRLGWTGEPMNRLGHETSPYLLQHKDNPVHWRPWGPEALAEAKARDKPILLSIGYAACHWCHVMAHESFEDEATAAVMNELFVNIKVDREERPDIDTIYMNAIHLLGQHGGWPLTMFLDPDGHPFWGGTYFPKTARYGMPAFADVLHRVREVYDGDKATVHRNSGELLRGLGEMTRSPESTNIGPALLDRMATKLAEMVDPEQGGLKGAPKFPQCALFLFLWRAWLRTGEAAYRNAVLLTLERMSQGGIYDHLGGGFARYSTDEVWLAPHFEKMLYDNAQILDLLGLAHGSTGSTLFAARIEESVDWLLREMIAPGGGFAATLDADSEGEEGKFYVWSEAEIDEILGAGAPRFKTAYGVSARGNWEGHNILNRSADPRPKDDAFERELAAQRAALFRVRDQRIKPGWDDKVLADWNGLMIAALTRAGMRFGRRDWLDAARRAFDFVGRDMTVEGRLCHAWRDGRRQKADMLDDYAAMALGALALHEATGAADCLQSAKGWVAVLDRHFWDAQGGGYFLTADDAEALIARPRHCQDNATPAGNGMMAEVLARLWHATGDMTYRDRAETLVAAFSGELRRNFLGLATLLGGLEILEAGIQVAIVGCRGEAETDALVGAAYRSAEASLIVTVVAPNADLPSGHPAHGKTALDGRATAYVCRGAVCSRPVVKAMDLAELLSKRDMT